MSCGLEGAHRGSAEDLRIKELIAPRGIFPGKESFQGADFAGAVGTTPREHTACFGEFSDAIFPAMELLEGCFGGVPHNSPVGSSREVLK